MKKQMYVSGGGTLQNRLGFTLIELLAVIVILAIIALIATPIVLNIISDTKRSAQLRSGDFYLDAVEQAISKEMMNDATFKAKECKIKEDGNLLCSELGFNVCEIQTIAGEYSLVCSGTEKEIKVEVSGETPSEGIIELNKGKIEDVKLILNNNSLVIKENSLAFENDSEVIYEVDSINLTDVAANIAHLVEFDSIYKYSLDYPAEEIYVEGKGMFYEEDGVTYLLGESGGGLMVTDKEPDTTNNVLATLKIFKTNQKVEKYGVRITPKRFLIISSEFVPGDAIVSIKDENDEFLYSNIVTFEKSVGNYVEVDKAIDSTAYNNLKENKKVTVIITQTIGDGGIIRQYGGITPPKYQEIHAYSLAQDSYYWGTDFFPFSGE